MKGLMIKDLKIIMSNNRLFIFVAIAIVFIFAFMDDPSFVMGYVTVLCSMMVLGTLSYDEFDNGYAFLFTLPVTRKIYVKGKYLFSIVYTLVIWAIVSAILGTISMMKGNEFDISFPVGVLASCYILISIMIPCQIKLGSEKSRIAIAAMVGAFFAIGFVVFAILSKMGIFLDDIELFSEGMSTSSTVAIVFGILAVTAVIMLISYSCCIKIIEKKEY